MLISSYAPNKAVVLDTVATTNWHQVDVNGADVAVTGAKGFPLLDPGTFMQNLKARSKTGADQDGSAFEIALNQATAPTTGEVVDGGPGFVLPGGNVYSVWIKKTVASDIVEITLRF